MKITREQILNIIKEEYTSITNEAYARSIVVVQEDAYRSLHHAHEDLQLLAQLLEKGDKGAEAEAVRATVKAVATGLSDMSEGEVGEAVAQIHRHDPMRG
jgi:hypothetical protein